MYALTLADDWADKIAHHGKDVENRGRRPPAHLMGQRIAIHAGRNASKHAGRIVATARLVGWVKGAGFLPEEYLYCHKDMRATVEAAIDSPWRTGHGVGWVLADVIALPEPVGEKDCLGCCFDTGQHPPPPGYCLCYGNEPIRGQVFPFALSEAVTAEVLRQESAARK